MGQRGSWTCSIQTVQASKAYICDGTLNLSSRSILARNEFDLGSGLLVLWACFGLYHDNTCPTWLSSEVKWFLSLLTGIDTNKNQQMESVREIECFRLKGYVAW